MQVNARKLMLLIVAVIIAALNVWHLIAPTASATLTPKAMAIINAIAGVAVMLLHVLQENGLITNATVPGLDALTGDMSSGKTVVNVGDVVSEATGAVKSIAVAVHMSSDAAAAPAAPTPKE